MTDYFNNSVVLITNSENQTFGTGFVIYKERNYSYILTCLHVVEDTPKTLLVDSVKAKIIHQGSSDGLDLAILKVSIEREPLPLLEGEGKEFQIIGFKNFEKDNHILEPIECKLDTKVEFRPKSHEKISAWKLNIDQSDIIVGGYSGSPLICKESGKVMGIISNRKGSKEGFAISIENLKTIWKDIPRNLSKKQNHIPKIFISSAHREPDISIAQVFSKELNSLGYKTFLAKTDITIGEDWLGRIQSELSECDYFLLLLSEKSLRSEMVLEELKKIKELQNGSNFPAILPVRLNLPFDKNINYDLLKQIDKIQQLVWEDENDTQTIINTISNVIFKEKPLGNSTEPLVLQDTDIPVPNAPLILEQPTGTVPLDSRNYIVRSDDERCYTALTAKYTLIRIKAPRQYGKTSLLARLIVNAKKEDYHVVTFNFQELDRTFLNDLEELLSYIWQKIAYELDIEVNLKNHFINRLTPMAKTTQYMQTILKSIEKPLVIAIDEADKLFEFSNISDEFFGLIRAWHEKSKQETVWENLKILLSHSTEPLLGVSNVNQSPFHNVGLGIELKPFTPEETKELAKRHNIFLDDAELDELMGFLGGHPFLSRKILFTMVDEKRSFKEITTSTYEQNSIFSDHMRRYLWILKDNEKLMGLIKAILRGERCKDDSSCYILEATGLIRDTLNKPEFSCELYREFFNRNILTKGL